jgi:hypothetical protein
MTTQVQGLGVLILPVALIANAERIVVAKNSGKLTAVLRNPALPNRRVLKSVTPAARKGCRRLRMRGTKVTALT